MGLVSNELTFINAHEDLGALAPAFLIYFEVLGDAYAAFAG